MEKAKIEAALAAHGLTISSRFIPFSMSRNKDSKYKSLNWSVTLQKDGRDILTADYSACEAHCPGYKKQAGDTPGGYERHKRIDYEVENGAPTVFRFGAARSDGTKGSIKPDLCDVVYSLVMDADVLNCAGFEDWASSFGYDTDSRQAEKIYRQCLEIAVRMRVALGDALMAELRELFSDY